MVVVGNGQLAKKFKEFPTQNNSLIFASGVANSKCENEKEFQRERELLTFHLDQANEEGRAFVYFSSCALSAQDYPLNRYYQHKKEMELLIREKTGNYFIFRIPQLFGKIKKHPTLINFFYYAILEKKKLKISEGAYRYVIDIDDVQALVSRLIDVLEPGSVLDLANPYRYKVLEIIQILEKITGIAADYTLVEKSDSYELNLEKLVSVLNEYDLCRYEFGVDYLEKKLSQRVAKGIT